MQTFLLGHLLGQFWQSTIAKLKLSYEFMLAKDKSSVAIDTIFLKNTS